VKYSSVQMLHLIYIVTGHTMKVIKKGFRLDVGKYSFRDRMVNEWNAQSEEIVHSKSWAGFKKI